MSRDIALANKIYGKYSVDKIREQANTLYEMARILDGLATFKEMEELSNLTNKRKERERNE